MGWLERGGDDFPFHNFRPIGLTGVQWLIVIAGVAVAFLALTFGPALFTGRVGRFIPVMLCSLLPLVFLAWVAGGHWRALFRPVRVRDGLLIIGFAILNLIVTLVAGSVLVAVTETTRNPGMVGLASQGALDVALFYGRAAIRLPGEELMTLLPFLAIMWLSVALPVRAAIGARQPTFLPRTFPRCVWRASKPWRVPDGAPFRVDGKWPACDIPERIIQLAAYATDRCREPGRLAQGRDCQWAWHTHASEYIDGLPFDQLCPGGRRTADASGEVSADL